MESKSDLQFVETLRKKMKSFNKNDECICHGCKKEPIRSHIIPESVLELLADVEGKVLTWERSDEEIIVNTLRGHEWDHIYKQPKKVHIGKNVTYPIFCNEHDNDIFEALEKPGHTFEPQKMALLAYRALCYKSWNPHLEKKLEFVLSNQDPETTLQLERICSLKSLLAARQKFEDMLAIQDYGQMDAIPNIV